MLRQADFVDRANLAGWLNRTGRTGEAVEVGTHRGVFAAAFLDAWEGQRLYCVDPWSVPPGYEGQVETLADSDGDRDRDFAGCREALARFGDRAVFIRETSAAAAPMFAPESLDLVYIDGDHREAAVAADLRAWWPRVRPGGVLAGHDFLCHGTDTNGVQAAVLDFAAANGLDVWLVVEMLCLPWSFLLEKLA
jgi:predicted O-methyltransferase YrrM